MTFVPCKNRTSAGWSSSTKAPTWPPNNWLPPKQMLPGLPQNRRYMRLTLKRPIWVQGKPKGKPILTVRLLIAANRRDTDHSTDFAWRTGSDLDFSASDITFPLQHPTFSAKPKTWGLAVYIQFHQVRCRTSWGSYKPPEYTSGLWRHAQQEQRLREPWTWRVRRL